MMAPTVHVRPARDSDAYALWLWANDPDARLASFGRSAIAWRDHFDWFVRGLNDASHLILIAETTEHCPVGTVRFDTEDQWTTARLSYAIAVEARGLKYSRPLVNAGIEHLRRLHPHVSIRADVMLENTRSLRVFQGLDWTQQPLDDNTVRFWLQ